MDTQNKSIAFFADKARLAAPLKACGWIYVGSDNATGVICTLLPAAPMMVATAKPFAIVAPIPEHDFRAIARGKIPRGPFDWKSTLTAIVERMAEHVVPCETYSARVSVQLSPSGSNPHGSRLDGIFLEVEFLPSSTGSGAGAIVAEHVYYASLNKRPIHRLAMEIKRSPARAITLATTVPTTSPVDGFIILGNLVLGDHLHFSGASFSVHGSGTKLWAVAAAACNTELQLLDPANATATEFGPWLSKVCSKELEARCGGVAHHLSLAFWADGAGGFKSMSERFAVVAVPCKAGETPKTIVQKTSTWPLEAFLGPHDLHATAAQALRTLGRGAERTVGPAVAEAPRRSPPKALPKGDGELLALLQDATAELEAPSLRLVGKRVGCRSTDPRLAEAAAARGVRFVAKDLLCAAGRGVCAELLDAMCAATSEEELGSVVKDKSLSGALRAALARRGVTVPSPAAPIVAKDESRSPTSTEMAAAAQRSRLAKREEVERKKAERAERMTAAALIARERGTRAVPALAQ